MLRLERHRYGPRLYVLGRRVHEYQLGLGLLAGLAVGAAADLVDLTTATALMGVVALWLVAKDWRDVFPSRRDTASWRLGIHRASAPLRAVRRGDGLPRLAAAVAFVAGVVSLASALTPNVAWRGRLLLQLEPVSALPVFHTLAVPASAALIVAAFYLARRRRRAWQAATGLLVVLGFLHLLKGLDVEEALLAWAGAALLWWGRDAFHVRHDRLRLRSALVPPLGLALGGAALAAGLIWITAPVHSLLLAGRETADLLVWRAGPIAFHDELSWLPLGVGLLGVSSLVAAASAVFRPLRPPRAPEDGEARVAALGLVHAHGADTLAFFKLRSDTSWFFSSDRRAFLGYRVQAGVLLVAGDPVGPPDALPGLLREAAAFAEERGLRLGGVGASRAMLPLYRQAGLRSLYIGDEAIVETASFSLEGRQIRKIRQSVSRLEKAGYEASLHELGTLDAATVAELGRVSEHWLDGAPERGFSMAMDSLDGVHQADSVVVVARDASGAIRGFLHFVPSYGRSAVSLSFMRRERDTPNGLTEFLVVRALGLLRERGVEEVSLNFAALAHVMQQPRNGLERALGRAAGLLNRFFQIESLYRFNAKFFPRWEPRYLVYEGVLGLPRVGLATLVAEGQLPSPRRALALARG